MAWYANLLRAWVSIGVATYGSVPRDFNLLMAGLAFYSLANPRLFLARLFSSYSVTRGNESARTGHRTSRQHAPNASPSMGGLARFAFGDLFQVGTNGLFSDASFA
jgi:hypothetical protein